MGKPSRCDLPAALQVESVQVCEATHRGQALVGHSVAALHVELPQQCQARQQVQLLSCTATTLSERYGIELEKSKP